MSSVFTMIIEGELPGRFVWKDDRCVAFLSINPLSPGHTLVVPREEVDHWINLDPALAAHLMQVAQRVAGAIHEVFTPTRVAMLIAGLEVPHTHLHLVAIDSEGELSFANADRSPDPAMLDEAALRIRNAMTV